MAKKKKKARKIRRGLSKEVKKQIEVKEKEASEHEDKMMALQTEIQNLQYPERVKANNLSDAFQKKFKNMIDLLKKEYNEFDFSYIELSCSVDRRGESIYFELSESEINLIDQSEDEDDNDDDYDNEEDN